MRNPANCIETTRLIYLLRYFEYLSLGKRKTRDVVKKEMLARLIKLARLCMHSHHMVLLLSGLPRVSMEGFREACTTRFVTTRKKPQKSKFYQREVLA